MFAHSSRCLRYGASLRERNLVLYPPVETMNLREGKFKATLWFFVALAGFVQAWANRFYIEPDGLSYLDIGYAYLHRDWPNAVNAYWSPLYSWLLAGAIRITRVPLSLESTL